MKKFRLILTTLAITLSAGSVFSATNAVCDPGERVVKFSLVTGGKTSPKVIAANNFAARVNKEMNGKLCVVVYPNSTLFVDSKALEALSLGDVQLLAPSLSKFGAYSPKFGIFDLPFIFKDLDQAIRFTETHQAKKLLTSMENNVGFVGLGYWIGGMKYFSANKKLILPSDAKGLKFRVQASDVAKSMISTMGASPQVMSLSEVYGALQTGVVDGEENSLSNIYTKKFYEVQDSITETNHQALAYLFMTSKDFLDSLSVSDRKQFIKIADDVTKIANESIKESDALNLEKIKKTGGKVNTLTPQQRQIWVDTMKPVWKKFEGRIGKDLINAAVNS